MAISGGMNDDDADKVISEYGSASGGSIIADSIDRAYEKLAAGGSPEYALEPLMRLLSDGLYAVSYVETYPTAGEICFLVGIRRVKTAQKQQQEYQINRR